MTAGTSQEVSSYVGCMNQCVGLAQIVGSSQVAAPSCSQVPSVPVSSIGHARGMPCGPSVEAVLSLEVEPAFLTHVTNATWHDTDEELCNFAHCTRGPPTLFHVKQSHGYGLVFRGSGV